MHSPPTPLSLSSPNYEKKKIAVFFYSVKNSTNYFRLSSLDCWELLEMIIFINDLKYDVRAPAIKH